MHQILFKTKPSIPFGPDDLEWALEIAQASHHPCQVIFEDLIFIEKWKVKGIDDTQWLYTNPRMELFMDEEDFEIWMATYVSAMKIKP